MRGLGTVLCATLCVVAGVGSAFASGSQRSTTLPFSGGCSGHSAPRVAPHLLGARAQIAVPKPWNVAVGWTGSGAGTICGRDYLLVDPPADTNNCEQDAVYAQAARGPRTSVSLLRTGVIVRGALPTVSGMRGAWAEVNVGVSGRYAAYQVVAAYEASNHQLAYELIVVPPSSYPGICRNSGAQARAIARQLARTFRVAISNPATAQTFP